LEHPSILVGDFNIAPLECDVWSHKALLDVVSHTPIEVETLGRLQAAADWTDLGRTFIKAPERLYTWWSYRAQDWRASDRGRRLDHMWATPDVASAAKGHRVHEQCRDWGKPSDHIPLVTEFHF
jgi:exodeoxyribonuclease-3